MKENEIFMSCCRKLQNCEHSTRELSNPMLKRVSLSPAIFFELKVGRGKST